MNRSYKKLVLLSHIQKTNELVRASYAVVFFFHVYTGILFNLQIQNLIKMLN